MNDVVIIIKNISVPISNFKTVSYDEIETMIYFSSKYIKKGALLTWH